MIGDSNYGKSIATPRVQCMCQDINHPELDILFVLSAILTLTISRLDLELEDKVRMLV
jgi:hypothetical protein